MEREEPRLDSGELNELDFEPRPRRRVEPPAPPSLVDWRIVWSVVLALTIVRLFEVLTAAVAGAAIVSALH